MEEICYADVVLTLFTQRTLCSRSSYCADSLHSLHLLCADTTRVCRTSTSTWVQSCQHSKGLAWRPTRSFSSTQISESLLNPSPTTPARRLCFRPLHPPTRPPTFDGTINSLSNHQLARPSTIRSTTAHPPTLPLTRDYHHDPLTQLYTHPLAHSPHPICLPANLLPPPQPTSPTIHPTHTTHTTPKTHQTHPTQWVSPGRARRVGKEIEF
jgi:hypothetical protein